MARIIHDGLAVPHTVAKGLIDAGCVTVNGRPAKSHGQRCDGGDVVEVVFDPDRQYHPTPTPRHGRGFRVIHEDREIVVVSKAPGILSSPAPGDGEESLAESIATSLRKRGIRKPLLFVVHRLDRHTSGLLVLARTPRALESLTAQFESRQAGREYVAVVEGRVQRDSGTIQSWLMEDPQSLSVRTTALRGAGKRAITHFEVMERFENATLVRVRLETGRKHQIRIHFAEIGHQVLGDRRYGFASPADLARRAARREADLQAPDHARDRPLRGPVARGPGEAGGAAAQGGRRRGRRGREGSGRGARARARRGREAEGRGLPAGVARHRSRGVENAAAPSRRRGAPAAGGVCRGPARAAVVRGAGPRGRR